VYSEAPAEDGLSKKISLDNNLFEDKKEEKSDGGRSDTGNM
jgi:hypothetical protein